MDVVEGTLSMIPKIGIEEKYDLTMMGHRSPGAHFSPGVTTDRELILITNLGLSSSSIFMKVSLLILYWGLSRSEIVEAIKSNSNASVLTNEKISLITASKQLQGAIVASHNNKS